MKAAKEELATQLEAEYRAFAREKEDREIIFRQRLFDDLEPERRALSRKMHEAHAAGLSKDRIRRVVKAYNNSGAWDQLWDAYVPEQETDLRKRAASAVETGLTADAEIEGRYWFEFEGRSLWVDGPFADPTHNWKYDYVDVDPAVFEGHHHWSLALQKIVLAAAAAGQIPTGKPAAE